MFVHGQIIRFCHTGNNDMGLIIQSPEKRPVSC